MGHLATSQGAIAQVGTLDRGYARLCRRVRSLPAAYAFDPIRQVQQLAVGLVIEVGAAGPSPYELAGRQLAVPLGDDFVPAAIEVQRPPRSP